MARLRGISPIFIILFVILVTTGCLNRQKPAEEMFEILERVVQIEKTFQDQQDPLVNLEKEEKELYKKISELNTQENHDEIVTLSESAITIAQKRQEHIDLERKSIMESKQEFNTVMDIIEKIEEAKLKEQAMSLYDLMQERYDIHEKLYESYARGLTNDIELYTLLKNEVVENELLESQVNKVNEAYQEVLTHNEAFNEKTEQYNIAKLQFYQSAGLDIQVDESEG